MKRLVTGNMRWILWGGLLLGGGSGCYTADPIPGYSSGTLSYVSTPASGANAQGSKSRSTSNAGTSVYNTGRCYYPDVTASDRRQKLAECVNTFEVGAGEAHGEAAPSEEHRNPEHPPAH